MSDPEVCEKNPASDSHCPCWWGLPKGQTSPTYECCMCGRTNPREKSRWKK